MSRNEKQVFCKTLHEIKVPNGYAGNISRCVNLQQAKLIGLKSHDCHILMQQLLPVALRGLLTKDVVAVLFDLCGYFREICSKNVRVSDLKRLEAEIPIIMCHLEMIFPPSFFTVMAHLVIHLATQTKLAGPVMFRWMYFIERYLGSLKSHVRNKAHPEASIAEAITAVEFANFVLRYLQGYNSKLKHILGIDNDVLDVESLNSNENFSLFSQVGKPLGRPSTRTIDQMSKIQAHRYVLFNFPEIDIFLKEHASELRRRSRPRRLSLKDIERIQHENFHEWFRNHVDKLEQTNGVDSLKEEVRMLARGPLDVITKYQGFNVNGFTFRAKRYDKYTQNSGVVVIAKTSSYASSGDRNPVLGDVAYYGRLVVIVKLKYLGGYSVVLFKCEWCDATSGRGVKKDEYNNYTLVNFSRMTNTGDRLEDEPFIFAAQAEQVYYIQDHIDPDWFVAMKMKPKDVYDLGDDEMMEDRENEPYHVPFLNNILVNAEGNHSWVRSDVEGIVVDQDD
nr:uncharacterized protein LOC110782543 [Spinacia oleracea]